jgi:hypothetical protein
MALLPLVIATIQHPVATRSKSEIGSPQPTRLINLAAVFLARTLTLNVSPNARQTRGAKV